MSSKTKFALSIIESLDFEDEQDRLEGQILRNILRLSGNQVDYIYIRTWKEAQVAFTRFYDSHNRYLHISCHGSSDTIALTLENVRFQLFGDKISNYLKDRRLFFSACEVVNDDLADAIMQRSRCYSLIGPRRSICFDDSAL